MVGSIVNIAEAAKLFVVARQHNFIFAFRSQKTIAFIRLERCPVKHKHQVATAKCQHLVAVAVPQTDHRQCLKIFYTFHKVYHGIVKSQKLAITQIFPVNKFPLATCIFIAPAITLARKINPFRMSELVAHKVKVSAVNGGKGYKPYHFVHGYTTVHSGIVVALHHVPVHLIVNQAENYGFVSHKRLVVAFNIADSFFVSTPVCKFPENRRWMPVLVFILFEHLNPVVGNAHCHTVVKAHAAPLYRICQPRHTAHFLGNGYGVAVHLVNQFVCQGKVCYCIRVLATVIIVGIAAKCLAKPVVIIQHRRNTVKAETVKAELLQPVFAVAQQKMQNLVLAIIKAKRVPGRMFATVVTIKILVIAAVKTAKPLNLVLHRMRMNYIHNHGYSARMSVINKCL